MIIRQYFSLKALEVAAAGHIFLFKMLAANSGLLGKVIFLLTDVYPLGSNLWVLWKSM